MGDIALYVLVALVVVDVLMLRRPQLGVVAAPAHAGVCDVCCFSGTLGWGFEAFEGTLMSKVHFDPVSGIVGPFGFPSQ